MEYMKDKELIMASRNVLNLVQISVQLLHMIISYSHPTNISIDWNEKSLSIKIEDNGEGLDYHDLLNIGFDSNLKLLIDLSFVSSIVIQSKTSFSQFGNEFDIKDGKISKPKHIDKRNIGSIILVNDLFYNIPVRRHAIDWNNDKNILSFAIDKLSWLFCNIKFTVNILDSSTIFHKKIEYSKIFPNYSGLNNNQFTKVNWNIKGLSIRGIIINNGQYNEKDEFQWLFINNLWSTCELISLLILQFYQHNHKCLIQGTHGTIPKKYYPVYFLEINCPKSKLDCWFYNGAQTICFKDEHMIKEFITSKMEEHFPSRSIQTSKQIQKYSPPTIRRVKSDVNFNEDGEEIIFIKKSSAEIKSTLSILSKWKNPAFKRSNLNNVSDINDISTLKSPKNVSREHLQDMRVLNQIEQSFIIFVSKGRIFVVDQHAAHERVLLEEIEKLPTSPKITKRKVKLNILNNELQDILRYTTKLNQLGFRYEIENNQIIISQVPSIENHLLDADSILEFVKEIKNGSRRYGAIQRARASISCRRAIKFGDKLSVDECTTLISNLSLCKLPFQCAHGRPTVVPLS